MPRTCLHPNQTAIDYIWIKFFEHFVHENEFGTMQDVCDIQKALHHKPFNPSAENHQQFLKKVNEKIVQIQQKLPHIQF